MSSQTKLAAEAIGGTGNVSLEQAVDVIGRTCPADRYHGKRVLLIIPDGTRTAPVGLMFKLLFAQIGAVTSSLDILVALGTHQPMNEQAICERLEISLAERQSTYAKVRFFNHEWDNPAALKNIALWAGQWTSTVAIEPPHHVAHAGLRNFETGSDVDHPGITLRVDQFQDPLQVIFDRGRVSSGFFWSGHGGAKVAAVNLRSK